MNKLRCLVMRHGSYFGTPFYMVRQACLSVNKLRKSQPRQLNGSTEKGTLTDNLKT
ncbi:MAG: hypothetical protein PWQ54_1313 [Bacteroidales bacterium]|jgi:hypothetical protein|nr:hypothetical protein [Bacteroidales bacterium]